MTKPKKPQFATPYKYVKQKGDKIYRAKAVKPVTEADKVYKEGRA